MWRDSAPSSGLAASTYQTGYWTPVRSYDTIPMEALVFGTTDDELSQITGFSSDPEKRSLAIQLEDGSSKHIGPEAPSPNSKVFKIDGKGGERVTKVEIGMNSLPMAIKVSGTAQIKSQDYSRISRSPQIVEGIVSLAPRRRISTSSMNLATAHSLPGYTRVGDIRRGRR